MGSIIYAVKCGLGGGMEKEGGRRGSGLFVWEVGIFFEGNKKPEILY